MRRSASFFRFWPARLPVRCFLCLTHGCLWLALAAPFVLAQNHEFFHGLEQRLEQHSRPGGSPFGRQGQLQDLQAFTQWMDRSYLPAFQGSPGWSPQRRAFVGRAMAYLGAMQGLAGRDRALHLAVASAYNRIGRLQELTPATLDREGALLSYGTSALILQQLAGENPQDAQVRGQLLLAGGRINALGGGLPIWISVPVGGQPASPPRGIPDAVARPPVPPSVPTADRFPKLEASQLSAEQLAEWKELRTRYSAVLSTVYAAKNSMAPIQSSVEGRGFGLSPDLVKGQLRMQTALDDAKAELEQRDFPAARESLQVAEGEARKLLRYLGQ